MEARSSSELDPSIPGSGYRALVLFGCQVRDGFPGAGGDLLGEMGHNSVSNLRACRRCSTARVAFGALHQDILHAAASDLQRVDLGGRPGHSDVNHRAHKLHDANVQDDASDLRDDGHTVESVAVDGDEEAVEKNR